MAPADNGGLEVHVIVEHPSLCLRTVYGHALAGSIAVEAGQVVQAGTQLAAVGNTGTSTAAHLHFEVRDAVTGEATDRPGWLAGWPVSALSCRSALAIRERVLLFGVLRAEFAYGCADDGTGYLLLLVA